MVSEEPGTHLSRYQSPRMLWKSASRLDAHRSGQTPAHLCINHSQMPERMLLSKILMGDFKFTLQVAATACARCRRLSAGVRYKAERLLTERSPATQCAAALARARYRGYPQRRTVVSCLFLLVCSTHTMKE